MALVILGGLVTSTLLNLLVVPTLYLRFGKGKNWTPSQAPAMGTD
jgi:Cu/Ag efflux pump CusA